MLDLASPWWLLALAVIPLIRWLHRWRAPLTRVPVSALFLWRSAARAMAGGASRQKPDPAWRRRAFVAALLVMALAGPVLLQDFAKVTVWVDDTLSMATREGDRSRLASGLQSVRAALDEEMFAEATLRSLTNPAKAIASVDSQAFDADSWLADMPLAADPPPVALMSRDTAHWVVSDGAGTLDWSRRAPLAHVIAVGRDTENVGLFRLVARRNLADARAADVLVSMVNHGPEPVRRELVLRSASGDRVLGEFVIGPGEIVHEQAIVPAGTRRLTALTQPGDALAADDALALDLGPLIGLRVFVDPACPSSLRQAVDAHGALRRIDNASDPELEFLCSDRNARGAAVRFHRGNAGAIEATPAWLPPAGALQNIALRPAWIVAAEWPGGVPTGTPVLVAGDRVLLTRSATGVLESVIDPGRGSFAGQPEYAAFVGGLVDLAVGSQVLDPVVAVSRDPLESDIAPRELLVAVDAAAGTSLAPRSLSGLLLVVALVLLLLDLGIVWRARQEAIRA